MVMTMLATFVSPLLVSGEPLAVAGQALEQRAHPVIDHGDTTLPQPAPASTRAACLRDVWRERKAVPKTTLCRHTLPPERQPTVVLGSSKAPEKHIALTMIRLTPTTSACYCGCQ